MVDTFLQIFEQTSLQLIPWIPGVIGVWLVVDLIAGLLFREK